MIWEKAKSLDEMKKTMNSSKGIEYIYWNFAYIANCIHSNYQNTDWGNNIDSFDLYQTSHIVFSRLDESEKPPERIYGQLTGNVAMGVWDILSLWFGYQDKKFSDVFNSITNEKFRPSRSELYPDGIISLVIDIISFEAQLKTKDNAIIMANNYLQTIETRYINSKHILAKIIYNVLVMCINQIDGDTYLSLFKNYKEILESNLDELCLSDLYLFQGIHLNAADEKIMYYKKSLKIRDLILGENHPMSALVVCHLASTYLFIENISNGVKYTQMAYSRYLNCIGEPNGFELTMAICMCRCADLISSSTDDEAEIQSMEKWINISKQIMDNTKTTNETYLAWYLNTTNYYCNICRYDLCIKLALTGLSLKASHETPFAYVHINLLANLSFCYDSIGEKALALKNANKGLQFLKKSEPLDSEGQELKEMLIEIINDITDCDLEKKIIGELPVSKDDYADKRWYDIPWPELIFRMFPVRNQMRMTSFDRKRYYFILLITSFLTSTLLSILTNSPANIFTSLFNDPIFSVEHINSDAKLIAFVSGFYIAPMIAFILNVHVEKCNSEHEIKNSKFINISCIYFINAFISNSVILLIELLYIPLSRMTINVISAVVLVFAVFIFTLLLYYLLDKATKDIISLFISIALLTIIRSICPFNLIFNFLIYCLIWMITNVAVKLLDRIGLINKLTKWLKWLCTPRQLWRMFIAVFKLFGYSK